MRVSQVAELRVAAEVADPAVRVEVGVLQRIFSLGVILEDRARHAKQPGVVPAHQRFERRLIAAPDAHDEVSIADGAAGRHGGDWVGGPCESVIY